MSAYVRQLQRQQALYEMARAEAKERARAEAAADRFVPLDLRLSRLLVGIPLEVQEQGLSLEFLRTRLLGRSGRKCHSGELGTALRKLKFTRKRQWAAGTGFKALSYPPKGEAKCAR